MVEIEHQIYLLGGDLDLLGERRRLGLTEREGDRRLGDLDLLGGDLLRGGDLFLLYPPRGEGRRRGGDRLQFLPPPPPPLLKGGGGGPLLLGGDGLLATALVVNKNLAVTVFPSICPPSILILAFSASSCFSNSTYPNPLGKSTFLSHANSTLFTGPKVPKISSK